MRGMQDQGYRTRGIGLAVTKQTPTVTKQTLQSPNGPTAIFCQKLYLKSEFCITYINFFGKRPPRICETS